MQVTDMPADLKFAVTECKVTDGAKSLILLNPGADASDVLPPSRGIDEICLSGTYEGFEKQLPTYMYFIFTRCYVGCEYSAFISIRKSDSDVKKRTVCFVFSIFKLEQTSFKNK